LEKFGQAQFYIQDRITGQKVEVQNEQHLTAFQEKQMAIQSDFILQYAQYLHIYFKENTSMKDPSVRAEVFVAVNSRPSKRYIRSDIDLEDQTDSWKPKDWINTRAF